MERECEGYLEPDPLQNYVCWPRQERTRKKGVALRLALLEQ